VSERSWAILDSCDHRSYLDSNLQCVIHERRLSYHSSCMFDCSTSRALDVNSSPSSDQSYEDLSARTRLLKGLLFYRENRSIGLKAALSRRSALSSALVTTPKHHFYNPIPTLLPVSQTHNHAMSGQQHSGWYYSQLRTPPDSSTNIPLQNMQRPIGPDGARGRPEQRPIVQQP
jgi:hypothetical protein